MMISEGRDYSVVPINSNTSDIDSAALEHTQRGGRNPTTNYTVHS